MLFFGKKKSTPGADLSWLEADMHSHLIPGIDDGSPDIETSLELITGLKDLGYKRLITTPHILWDMYQNTPEIINEGLQQVQNAIAEEKLDITLSAAAEYYIDDHFESQLAEKEALLKLKENWVLVEFSMVTAQMDIQQILFEMQIQGYQPIIAHAERYSYLAHNKGFYDELRDAGCMLQVNLLSLVGYYGKGVQELAEYLIKKEYYDFAGTDLHNARHLAQLQKVCSSPLLERLKDSGKIKNHLL
jgi:protein-tyrosine phosphatase